MIEYKDSTSSLYPKTGGGTGFRKDEGISGESLSGLVSTVHGYVDVTSHNYQKWKSSRLSIIKEGKIHTRYFKKAFTQRGLVTKAKQFAHDVFYDDQLVSL